MRYLLSFLLIAGALSAGTPSKEELSRNELSRLPVVFEPNTGQADAGTRFIGHAQSLTALINSSRIALSGEGVHLEIELEHARRDGKGAGVRPQGGVSNYLRGNDPSKWLRDVPHFEGVSFESVYPGIDAIYYGTRSSVEYDFRVAPEADASAIGLRFHGSARLSLNRSGDLVLGRAPSGFAMKRPVAYQERNGTRVPVEVSYRVKGDRVTFHLGGYDHSQVLIIDPVLDYSSYYSGAGADNITGIASDADSIYMVSTASSLFYGTGVPEPLRAYTAKKDIVVTRILSADNANIRYYTFLGGAGDDVATGITIGPNNTILVCGSTTSSDLGANVIASALPPGPPFANVYRGNTDGLVMQLSADGKNILFSAYIGGTGNDVVEGLSYSSTGLALTGVTSSTDFPVLNALSKTLSGASDAFVTVLRQTTAGPWMLAYSSYLGGTVDEHGERVVSFSNSFIGVTGLTTSTDYPVTANAISLTNHGRADVFYSRLQLSTSLVNAFSTYLGGSSDDAPHDMKAVNTGPGVVIGGETSSPDFPKTAGAYSTFQAGVDGFVLRLDDVNGVLVWSTCIHGAGIGVPSSIIYALDVDRQDSVWVAGGTSDVGFPYTAGTPEPGLYQLDLFVTRFDPTGSSVLYSTHTGGSSYDQALALKLDALGNVWVAGQSYSLDFPLSKNARFPGPNSGTGIVTGADEGVYLRVSGIDSACAYQVLGPGDLNSAAQTVTLKLITSGPDCKWRVLNSSTFAKLTSPLTGTGLGNVTLTVPANTTGALRQAAIYIGPQLVLLRQRANLDKIPVIFDGGIAGAALSQPPVLKLSYNGIFTIFGANFAPDGTASVVGPSDVANGFLPARLAGACVQIGSGLLPMLAVYPGQISAIAPATMINGVTSGDAPAYLKVVTSCDTANPIFSNTELVPFAEAAPEFLYFKLNTDGVNPVAAADGVTGAFIGPTDLIPGATSPIAPGGYATIYGVGFGATTPAIVMGQPPAGPAQVQLPYQVFLGDTQLSSSDVLYAGVTPGSAGLYQLNIHVPTNTAAGKIPLKIQIGTRVSPMGGFLTVGSK